jgi:hypothetical protein
MTTPLVLRANAELVTAAYVRTIVAAFSTAVGAVLQGPDDQGVVQWGPTGFVQFTTISDPINLTVPLRHSVVSLDIWAANTGSSKKPPWNLAYSIAETIIEAQFDREWGDNHAVVSLPAGYPDARVTEFSIANGPKRTPSDQSDFAHLTMECGISWHGLSA